MDEKFLVKLIANSAVAGDEESVAKLTDMLNEMRNPVPEKKRRPANKSGVVQVDAETGKEIARFETIKAANIAIGKPEKATGIGDAMNRESTHFAYGFRWFHADEFDAQ